MGQNDLASAFIRPELQQFLIKVGSEETGTAPATCVERYDNFPRIRSFGQLPQLIRTQSRLISHEKKAGAALCSQCFHATDNGAALPAGIVTIKNTARSVFLYDLLHLFRIAPKDNNKILYTGLPGGLSGIGDQLTPLQRQEKLALAAFHARRFTSGQQDSRNALQHENSFPFFIHILDAHNDLYIVYSLQKMKSSSPRLCESYKEVKSLAC